jgi:hypothetical protein
MELQLPRPTSSSGSILVCDHVPRSLLGPKQRNKFSVSSWMNPKLDSDGSLTIYIQQTSPGADLELIGYLPLALPVMSRR